MKDYSTQLRKFLNDNFRESYTAKDGSEAYYHTFSSNYFVKHVDQDGEDMFYILEKSGEDVANDDGRLNFYLPTKAFTADEIKAIIGTADYNEYGIVE